MKSWVWLGEVLGEGLGEGLGEVMGLSEMKSWVCERMNEMTVWVRMREGIVIKSSMGERVVDSPINLL